MLPCDGAVVQQQTQTLVADSREAVGNALDFLEQSVDRLASRIAGPVAAVVVEHLGLPAGDGLGRPGALEGVDGG